MESYLAFFLDHLTLSPNVLVLFSLWTLHSAELLPPVCLSLSSPTDNNLSEPTMQWQNNQGLEVHTSLISKDVDCLEDAAKVSASPLRPRFGLVPLIRSFFLNFLSCCSDARNLRSPEWCEVHSD